MWLWPTVRVARCPPPLLYTSFEEISCKQVIHDDNDDHIDQLKENIETKNYIVEENALVRRSVEKLPVIKQKEHA